MSLRKSYNKPLINLDRLEITRSKDIRPRSFMYGPRPTGYVRSGEILIWYLSVMTTLSVNKKLILILRWRWSGSKQQLSTFVVKFRHLDYKECLKLIEMLLKGNNTYSRRIGLVFGETFITDTAPLMLRMHTWYYKYFASILQFFH